jgi:hypothetical protein
VEEAHYVVMRYEAQNPFLGEIYFYLLTYQLHLHAKPDIIAKILRQASILLRRERVKILEIPGEKKQPLPCGDVWSW